MHYLFPTAPNREIMYILTELRRFERRTRDPLKMRPLWGLTKLRVRDILTVQSQFGLHKDF
jgi:hypothetical protein